MLNKISRIIFPLVLLIYFAVLFVQSLPLPTASRQLPELISGLAILLLLWQIVEEMREPVAKSAPFEVNGESDNTQKPTPWYKNKNLQVGSLIVLYLVAMNVIGYVVSTALFAVSVMLLLGRRGKVVYIVGPLIAIGSWVLFGMFFHLNLPHGFLF